jgi:hypothetical protein
MSKKQNTAEKYLTTARTSLIDYIFAALIGIGVFLFIFWWAYYGMIAMLIGIIGLICTRASKIKDEEFDEELRLALRDNNVEITSNCRLEIFDLCRGPVTFTKEKKARSGFFVITEFFFKEEKCDIIKHDVDIVGKTVTTEHYTIALPSSTAIEEQEVSTPSGKRKMAFLLINNGEVKLPVDITSLDTDDIVKKFG